jgi:hypothetical protein
MQKMWGDRRMTEPQTTTFAPSDSKGFFAIEAELQKSREQRKSVREKETPFRVEFRYPRGTKHWQYFETYDACLGAEDSKCNYIPWGHAIVERPTSRQIQTKGPKGGWRKYVKA